MFEKYFCQCCGETVKKVEEYKDGISLCSFCLTKIRMFDRLYQQKKDNTFWNEYSFLANSSNQSITNFLNNRYAEHIEKLKNGPRVNHEVSANPQPGQIVNSKSESAAPASERKTASFAGDMTSSIKNLIETNKVAYNKQSAETKEYDFDQECDKYLKIFKSSIKIAFWLEIIASVITGIAFFEDGEGLLIMIGGIIVAVGSKIVSTLLLHFLININKIRKNTEKMLNSKQE